MKPCQPNARIHPAPHDSVSPDLRLVTASGDRIVLDPDTAAFLLSRPIVRRCAECGREPGPEWETTGPCVPCAARRHELTP